MDTKILIVVLGVLLATASCETTLEPSSSSTEDNSNFVAGVFIPADALKSLKEKAKQPEIKLDDQPDISNVSKKSERITDINYADQTANQPNKLTPEQALHQQMKNQNYPSTQPQTYGNQPMINQPPYGNRQGNLQNQQPGYNQPQYQPLTYQQPGGYQQRGNLQPGYVQPGYQQPGNLQPGYQQPGNLQPGYQQPGNLQPGYQQPGNLQPGYQQPGNLQPGYSPPGNLHPGYPQPGNPQPGYQQPGYSQPGYSQPGYPQTGYQLPGYQQNGAYPLNPAVVFPSQTANQNPQVINQQPAYQQPTPNQYFAPNDPIAQPNMPANPNLMTQPNNVMNNVPGNLYAMIPVNQNIMPNQNLNNNNAYLVPVQQVPHNPVLLNNGK